MQNGMDVTRVVRAVELYMDVYFLGEQFPADPRRFPTPEKLPQVDNWQQLRDYVLHAAAVLSSFGETCCVNNLRNNY